MAISVRLARSIWDWTGSFTEGSKSPTYFDSPTHLPSSPNTCPTSPSGFSTDSEGGGLRDHEQIRQVPDPAGIVRSDWQLDCEKVEGVSEQVLEWQAMEAFEFAEPPSPTSRARFQTAPPLGTKTRSPHDPLDSDPRVLLSRFTELLQSLVSLVRDAERTGRADILPCLQVGDIVREFAGRINYFSDSGVALWPEFHECLWPSFMKALVSIFSENLGRMIPQQELTDILGCVFDIELMPNAMPVPTQDVRHATASIFAHCDPVAAIGALCGMLRHQYTESAHINDARSVSIVVDGLMCVSKRAGEQPEDYKFMLNEVKLWCAPTAEGDDSYERLEAYGFTINDAPLLKGHPSPLGTMACVVRNIRASAGAAYHPSILQSLRPCIGLQRVSQMLNDFDGAASQTA